MREYDLDTQLTSADEMLSPDDMMDMSTEGDFMSRKETPAQAALRKAEAGKLATGLAGMTADMTPFVGGAKAATELPDDLSYAKALVEEGYDEGDIKKMGLGGAFTALSILGLVPGVKIAADVGKAAVKGSVKDQMENLITPKRAEQLELAKTLPKEDRRRFLKEVNRPTPKVFHGAANISKKVDSVESKVKMDEFDYKLTNNLKTMSTTQELGFKDLFGKKKSVPLKTILEKDESFLAIIPEKGDDFVEPYLADLKLMPRVLNTKSARNEAGFEVEYDRKTLDLVDETDEVFGSIPIEIKVENGKAVPYINAEDLDSELRAITARTRDEAINFYTPKFSSKGEQLEKEGFAPYTETGPLSGGSRRTAFRSDKSGFGSAQTGQHIELKGIKALSTSRDPLVSMKDAFGSRILANLVYADLPKAEQRNLLPKEYRLLTKKSRTDAEADALREEILDSEGIPLSFPKSAHDEAEVALTRPQELNVKRLSEDDKRIFSGYPTPGENLEKLPTKGTGKLPLAERVAEGQRLVNRLFSQAEKLNKINRHEYRSDATFTQDYYSTLRNMFKDAQSLGKYTEQYGARGTYDSFLETVAQNSSFKESLNRAVRRMPDGEKKRNMQVLHEVLDAMAFAPSSATKRARRATKGMSDKELNKILFNRPSTINLNDKLTGLGYNDYKRMAFMVTQKLNRGGLMAKK
jgi:hypothetical protein